MYGKAPHKRQWKCLPLWHASVLSPRHSPQEAPLEEGVEGAPPLQVQPKTQYHSILLYNCTYCMLTELERPSDTVSGIAEGVDPVPEQDLLSLRFITIYEL